MPPVAVPVPFETPSTRIVTVLPASAVPVKLGVVTLVMLSVLEEPLSLAAVKSGVDGAAGATLSCVMRDTSAGADSLPDASVAVHVKDVVPNPTWSPTEEGNLP